MIRIYKGKRVDNNEIIYGSLSEEYDGTCFISYWIDKLIEPETNFYEPVQYWYEVIKESVSQSTGEKDKMGYEVFENDDVKLYISGKPVICKIIYKYGMHCLLHKDGYVNHYPIDFKNLEIIK